MAAKKLSRKSIWVRRIAAIARQQSPHPLMYINVGIAQKHMFCRRNSGAA